MGRRAGAALALLAGLLALGSGRASAGATALVLRRLQRAHRQIRTGALVVR